MTTRMRRILDLPRIPLAILLLSIAIVGGGRIVTAATSATGPDAALVGDDDDAGVDAVGAIAPPVTGVVDPLSPATGTAASADLERIRANIGFWGTRSAADPRDFISATRLAAAHIELARATGDIGAYLAADAAVDTALEANPAYAPARDYQGVVLVALHRFTDAVDHGRTVLADRPDDPAALATLGDAALELGDLATAAAAYERLSIVADGAAVRVRRSHLAFIAGRTDEAVAASRSALEAAAEEGAAGSGLAWFHYQLGETLAAVGDHAGAADAYAAALAADPGSHLARLGLARIAAGAGRLDTAIAQLDAAIATLPLPESLARRADLYALRGAPGDVDRERDDRRTVLAIAQLAGDTPGVTDRSLSLYLANQRIEVERALDLAEREIAVRRDVYGYDALAWALLANDRPVEADEAMTTALAFGTRDAKLLYHAGMIAAAVDDDARAHDLLSDALALDDTFDPAGAARARATLETLR